VNYVNANNIYTQPGFTNKFDGWTSLNDLGGIGFQSAANSAKLYPNATSLYGAWRTEGSRNSWHGMSFATTAGGDNVLMMGTTTQTWADANINTGVWNSQGNDWLWYFQHRTLYADALVDLGGTSYKMDPNGSSVVFDVTANGCVVAKACPTGFTGVGDVCIEATDRSAAVYRTAMNTCAGIAANPAHLCTMLEYFTATGSLAFTNAYYWSADVETANPTIVHPYNFNGDTWSVTTAAMGSSYAYRCCRAK
jgi:hypothetical protein